MSLKGKLEELRIEGRFIEIRNIMDIVGVITEVGRKEFIILDGNRIFRPWNVGLFELQGERPTLGLKIRLSEVLTIQEIHDPATFCQRKLIYISSPTIKEWKKLFP